MTEAFSEILYSVADRVATITLNRPERMNAWSTVMEAETRAAFSLAVADDAVRAIVLVSGAGSAIVNGVYVRREAAAIPAAFALVCASSGWDSASTWTRLNGGRAWWESPNSSYLYFNRGDGQWWLDSGATGLGLYVSRAPGEDGAPPREGWSALGDGALPLPTVSAAHAGREL